MVLRARSGWGYHSILPCWLIQRDQRTQSWFLALGRALPLLSGCCCEHIKPRLGWMKGSAPFVPQGIRSPLEVLDFPGEEEAVLGRAGGVCPSVHWAESRHSWAREGSSLSQAPKPAPECEPSGSSPCREAPRQVFHMQNVHQEPGQPDLPACNGTFTLRWSRGQSQAKFGQGH